MASETETTAARTTDDEVAFAAAARQAEMVREGEISPTELVQLHLDRIERLDPQLNAFRVVLAERALIEAEQAEARLKAGEERPLLGVPIALKDGHDLAGEVSSHGTDAFPEPAREDAEMVRRLREAGAIMIGKTHLPELAIHGFTESATWGVTRNPWNPQRSTARSASRPPPAGCSD
jgi:amidase